MGTGPYTYTSADIGTIAAALTGTKPKVVEPSRQPDHGSLGPRRRRGRLSGGGDRRVARPRARTVAPWPGRNSAGEACESTGAESVSTVTYRYRDYVAEVVAMNAPTGGRCASITRPLGTESASSCEATGRTTRQTGNTRQRTASGLWRGPPRARGTSWPPSGTAASGLRASLRRAGKVGLACGRRPRTPCGCRSRRWGERRGGPGER